MNTLLIVLLAVIWFFLMALFYCVQKGVNEIVSALNAIHEELRKRDPGGKR